MYLVFTSTMMQQFEVMLYCIALIFKYKSIMGVLVIINDCLFNCWYLFVITTHNPRTPSGVWNHRRLLMM